MNASSHPGVPRRGLLLLAHGARDPQWSRPFEQVAAQLAARPGAPSVQLCFLEFMTPGLVQGGQMLAAQGCQHIDVVPMFLGVGGHVRKDVPVLLAQLQEALPDATLQLKPAIGERADVLAAMVESIAAL